MPLQPSKHEDEYFLRLEAERLARIARERQASQAAEAKAKAKELHWMHCPKCGEQLDEVRYGEIDIDRCFACGGVWLDNGELEKVVEQDADGAGLGDFMRSLLTVFRGRGQ